MPARRLSMGSISSRTNWRRRRASSRNLLTQLSLQRDLRNAGKCLRQWAVALRRSRDLLELRVVDAGHRRLHRQRDAVDYEAFALLGQAHAGLGVDVGGCRPGLNAGEIKRHTKKRGVGCAQNLLGVGAAPVILEAASKAIRVVLQRTGLGTYLAFALLALAFPVHAGGLFGHRVAPISVWVECVTNFAALVQFSDPLGRAVSSMGWVSRPIAPRRCARPGCGGGSLKEMRCPPNHPKNDQIDRNNVIEQARVNQDEDAGHQGCRDARYASGVAFSWCSARSCAMDWIVSSI